MENFPDLKKISKKQQALETSKKTVFPRASQRSNTQDIYKSKKLNLSYADLHHEITKTVNDAVPTCRENDLKQKTDSKEIEEDELVKHMSNLPSYLERGENLQEKVLNVGVLDWGRLEKWKYSHKQIPPRSSQSSVFSTNTSSSISADESSDHSSKARSCSTARQRNSRPSLSSFLENPSPPVKSFGGSVANFQDLKASQENRIKQEKLFRRDETVHQSHSAVKFGQCEYKDSNFTINPQSATLPNGMTDAVSSRTKLKPEPQGSNALKKGEENSEARSSDDRDQTSHQKEKTVPLLPRDFHQSKLCGGSKHSDSTTTIGQRMVQANRMSLSERSKEVCNAALHSDYCRYPFLGDVDRIRHLQKKQSSSTSSERNNFLPERSHLIPRFSKTGVSPSKTRNVEHKRSTIIPVTTEPSAGSDPKLRTVESQKERSSSPFHRFSFSIGKTSKTCSSKDNSTLPRMSSTNIFAKAGQEKTVATCCNETSSCDKPSVATRSRSSPLRRLLDPLMKPKAVISRNFSKPLQKDSTSSDTTGRSLDGRPHSSVQSAQVKLNMINCKPFNVEDGKKYVSTSLQALFRVAVKSGQPVFTFAVDNESKILAATMKSLSTSENDGYSCIYTFFTIQEVKKKNGRWINQGDKGESNDYVRNVVAQMRASGSESSNPIRRHSIDQSSFREFVLFAVDLGNVDQQASDFQPNEELAAIVIKIPKRTSRNSVRGDDRSGDFNYLPEVGSKAYIAEERLNSKVAPNVKSWPFVSSRNISATVILPSGAHSLPHKGGPSSLIQRWRTGGSCDCGGWDAGCKLRILANQNQQTQKSSSSSLNTSSVADQLDLFFLGEVEESQPFFRFSPFQEGIYSVAFNSSVSFLQAFSICIATWDSKKLCEITESSNLFKVKNPRDVPTLKEGGIPAMYVSYPPLSSYGKF